MATKKWIYIALLVSLTLGVSSAYRNPPNVAFEVSSSQDKLAQKTPLAPKTSEAVEVSSSQDKPAHRAPPAPKTSEVVDVSSLQDMPAHTSPPAPKTNEAKEVSSSRVKPAHKAPPAPKTSEAVDVTSLQDMPAHTSPSTPRTSEVEDNPRNANKLSPKMPVSKANGRDENSKTNLEQSASFTGSRKRKSFRNLASKWQNNVHKESGGGYVGGGGSGSGYVGGDSSGGGGMGYGAGGGGVIGYGAGGGIDGDWRGGSSSGGGGDWGDSGGGCYSNCNNYPRPCQGYGGNYGNGRQRNRHYDENGELGGGMYDDIVVSDLTRAIEDLSQAIKSYSASMPGTGNNGENPHNIKSNP